MLDLRHQRRTGRDAAGCRRARHRCAGRDDRRPGPAGHADRRRPARVIDAQRQDRRARAVSSRTRTSLSRSPSSGRAAGGDDPAAGGGQPGGGVRRGDDDHRLRRRPEAHPGSERAAHVHRRRRSSSGAASSAAMPTPTSPSTTSWPARSRRRRSARSARRSRTASPASRSSRRSGRSGCPMAISGRIFAEVAKHGGIMAVHAEEDDIVTYMTEKLKREGRAQGHNLHLVHNNLSEDLAFRHIIRLARHTGSGDLLRAHHGQGRRRRHRRGAQRRAARVRRGAAQLSGVHLRRLQEARRHRDPHLSRRSSSLTTATR